MMVYICTKYHENILDSMEVIERCPLYYFHTVENIFIAKTSKGHNSVKDVDGVTVLFLCTWSDDGLYFYKVS